MKLSHIYIMCAASLLTTACTSEAEQASDVAQGSQKQMTFTVSQEGDSGAQTRVAFNNETKLIWEAGDKIGIYDGTSVNPFTLIGEGGTTIGAFKGEAQESGSYIAVYPYSDEIFFYDSTIYDITLPNNQTATPGSFDKNAALFIAKSSDKKLVFKNVAAYFKVIPDFDCSEIVVKANNPDNILAGTISVTIEEDETLTYDFERVFESSNWVKLTGDIKKGETYYIALFPGTLSAGFTVTLKPELETCYYKEKTSSYTLNRNNLCNLGVLSKSDMTEKKLPYITFTASDEQGLTLFNNSNGINANSLQCSVNGGEWTDFEVSSTVQFGGGIGDLRLRAKNNNGIYCGSVYNSTVDGVKRSNLGVFLFTNDTPVYCSGDIRTLIDYENYDIADTKSATFKGLFAGLTALKSAPELPITTIYEDCYYQMFQGCTGLTTAPKLPAMNLAFYCYAYMFQGCTGLTTAPELPATTLVRHCYYAMFSGCKGLTIAPKLPATKLENSCYYQMFSGCEKLSNVEMLATDVTSNQCLYQWLNNAGTGAAPRTLTLANKNVYNTLVSKGIKWLPEIWQSEKATISYQSE